MKESVLITGASGFVGYHLIEAALRHGLEVVAAVRKSSQVAHLQHLPVQYISLDFTNEEALYQVLATQQYQYILHAAGTTKAPDQEAYNLVNATYTRNLAAAAARAGVKKFLFISSLAALGPATPGTQITENTVPQPITSYGRSKLLAEQELQGIPHLPLSILRPTAVYGPREKDIFILFRTFRKGLEPYIGRRPQQLSFVYVTDLAAAALNLLLAAGKGVYNVSDGRAYNRYALADIAKRFLGQQTLKIHIPVFVVKIIAGLSELLAKKGSTPALNKEKIAELTAANWDCSITRLQQAIRYQPAYDLEKGLGETLSWYQANGWLSKKRDAGN